MIPQAPQATCGSLSKPRMHIRGLCPARRCTRERAKVHPHPRGRRTQPQVAECGHSARPAGRYHGSVRVGQELAGVRHHLRRRPAQIHGIAEHLRPAVSRSMAEAGRRVDRGIATNDCDPTAGRRSQPALDRGYDHRDLRLPAGALCPLRHADVLGGGGRLRIAAAVLRPAHFRHGRHPDRRCASELRHRHAADDLLAGGSRQEGLSPGGDRRLAEARVCPSPRQRPDHRHSRGAQGRRRQSAGVGPIRATHHRGGRRSRDRQAGCTAASG